MTADIPVRAVDPRAPQVVRAGPLEATLEQGTLRWIRLGGREVVRGIYAAVRDGDWGTIQPAFSRYEVGVVGDAFRVRFTAEHVRADGIDFAWEGAIIGEADGRIRFTFAGAARSTFQAGRIGFCVLHPRDLAGARVDIDTPWATVQGRFPRLIPGSTPFAGITAMRQLPGTRDEVRIAFEGDLFEMEDQRNWTDASFKTFCRPLSLPVPYLVEAGMRVDQAVEVEVGPRARSRLRTIPTTAATIAVGSEPQGSLPAIGLIAAPLEVEVGDDATAMLRELGPAHLRGTVDLAGDADRDLDALLARAAPLGAPLELELVGPRDGAGCEAILARLERAGVAVARILAFDRASHVTTRALAAAVREACRSAGLSVPIGGGTRANFWNLNTHPLPADLLDQVSFRLCPQVHAFDADSILETIASHADLVATARALAPGRSIAVGPITLAQVINPDRVGEPPPTPAGSLPERYDRRQPTLLAATWALGTIAALAAAGVAAITIYETAGWGGLIAADDPSTPPMPVTAGTPFPAYAVMASILEWRDAATLPVTASAGLAAIAIASRQRGRRVLVANLETAPCEVTLRLPAGTAWALRTLEDAPGAGWTAAGALRAGQRLELGPCGVARLDDRPT